MYLDEERAPGGEASEQNVGEDQNSDNADDANEGATPKEGTPEWEQREFDKANSNIEANDSVCLISKKWYDLWKDYTANEGPRPSGIENNTLISKTCEHAIEKGKIEDLDFVFITPSGYKLLSDWYGGGPLIERRQEPAPIYGTTVKLYPCIINLTTLTASGKLEGKLLKYDREDMTLNKLLKNEQSAAASAEGEGAKAPYARLYVPLRLVEEAFRTTDGKERGANTHYFPENLDKEQLVEVPAGCSEWTGSLGDLRVLDGDDFMIEFRDGKSWPSTKYDMTGADRSWFFDVGDDLPIGMHCRIMDKYNKWHHGCVVGRRKNEDTSRLEYRVHFMQWEKKYDEWVQFTSGDRFKPIDEDDDEDVKYLWQGMKKKSSSKRSASTGNYYGSSYSSRGSYNTYYNHEEGSPTSNGIVGLRNLGNTCFMNSIIQCLAQSPYLIPYFAKEHYRSEINADNPLGKEGKIAEEWAKLVTAMWSNKYRVCVPYDFKKTVGSFSQQFLGYNQQDSQEFLNFLLDGLHEDLNRVLKKPYVAGVEADGRPDHEVAAEAWERHLMRNQSVIVDLMQGQLKSKVDCPVCSRTSITFDPFMFLSVPVPTDNHKTQIVTWVPAPFNPGDTFKSYGIKIGREDNILQLKTLFKKQTEITVPLSRVICMDVYNGRVYPKEDDEGISGLMESDDIFLYEIEVINQPKEVDPAHKPDICHVRILHCKARSRWNTDHFGIPMFFAIDLNLPIDPKDIQEYVFNKGVAFLTGDGNKKLNQYMAAQVQADKERDLEDKNVPAERAEADSEGGDGLDAAASPDVGGEQVDGSEDPPGAAESNDKSNPAEDGEDEGEDLDDGRDDEFEQVAKEADPWQNNLDPPFEVKWSRKRSHNWGGDPIPWSDFASGDERFIHEIYIFWDEPRQDYDSDKFDEVDNREKDESVPDKRGRSSSFYSPRESKPINLESCMSTFTETEILGEDNLWYCNKCREHQRASKTMEIWSANDILIIHLKRFKYTKWNREKIDREVIFPLEGLDISPWVVNKDASSNACLYDLYGVSNHSGGLGGGHYTAYVRNLVNGEWFSCNDSYCSPVSDTSQIFGPEAYLLFYKRRKPSSGPVLMAKFNAAPEEPEHKSDPVADEKVQNEENTVEEQDEEVEAADGVQGVDGP